ncbi:MULTISPECIES: ATPase inhibitor subunit zeta [Bradyrhizobium]|uniref:ATPase inhibitor subunit zeta n=1 Tax=Bradyrhizobium elkanii TaxID=29448 RepID=UPI0004252580
MTTFDEREKAVEAKFAHDEELRFKAMAQANKLLGNWAAVHLGLIGEDATSCFRSTLLVETSTMLRCRPSHSAWSARRAVE